MNVSKDCVVTFHYQLTDDEHNQLEDSRMGEPVAYLHGAGNIFPLMEAAMEGKTTGDSFAVTLAPEDAYGIRVENALQRISRKHVVGNSKLVPGMIININTEQGERQVIVKKAGKFVVDVDTNHPMAGKTLTFAIEIVDIREASTDELTHRHAHGAGGHQH